MIPLVTPAGRATLLGTANNHYPLLRDGLGNAPLLDRFPANNLFYGNDAYYPSDAALSTAIGETGTWPKKKAGPNAFGSQIVTNGTFDTDASGWSTTIVDAPLTASGGKLVQTNNTGATTAMIAYQDLALVAGKSYELSADVVGSFGRQIALADGTTTVQMSLGSPSGAQTVKYYFAYQGSGARLYLRSNNVGNGGSASWDNISVKECSPFTGWLPNGVTVAIRAVTPASVSSDQVLWESGGLNEDNRVRLVYQSDSHLRLIGGRDGSGGPVTRFTVDLGAISTSTAFRVAISAANGAYKYSLNGLATVAGAATADYPVGAIMYSGTDSANADWLGSVSRQTVFAAAGSDGLLAYATNPGANLAMMGDSYVAGAAGIGLAETAAAAGRTIVAPSTLATGGTTDVAQLAALQADPAYRYFSMLWCDGRANTGYDSTLYLQNQQTFASLMPHNFWVRVGPSALPGDDAATQAKILATADALRVMIPAANYVDPRDVWLNSGGIIDPSLLQGDGVHPTQPADNSLWAAIDAKLSALGAYSRIAT